MAVKALLFFLLTATAAFAGDASFWVWDLTVMPPGFRKPQFTHYRGDDILHRKDRVELWVEEDLGEHQPSVPALDKLLDILARHSFEEALDPATSLIDLELRVFGNQPTPPSRARDFNIVIAAIPPYEKNGKKFGFDGYFNAYDQLAEADAAKQSQHSNERNVIYVNALQDINSVYMRGVIAHELAHLLSFGQYDEDKNPLAGWLNEMIGEAAMQVTGYFTDQAHVEHYRLHTEWPLAVEQYGVSYGGLSLFAEYLMKSFDPLLVGKIASAQGAAFERLEKVYGMPWAPLFAGYAKWLFEKQSRFPGEVEVRTPPPSFPLAPTGVLYLPARLTLQA